MCIREVCSCKLLQTSIWSIYFLNGLMVHMPKKVLSVVTKRNSYHVIPCNLVDYYRRFESKCCLHLQYRRVSSTWKGSGTGIRRWRTGARSAPMRIFFQARRNSLPTKLGQHVPSKLWCRWCKL
jgi:hypothetical protein